MSKLLPILSAAVALAFASTEVSAAPIAWADWTYSNRQFTSAGGTFENGVAFTYNGSFEHIQTSGYWSSRNWQPGDYWSYAGYDGLSNRPTNGDFIAPSGNGRMHVITFSQAVVNPTIAIMSLGHEQFNIATTWTFDAPFTVISNGAGFGGNGVFEVSGNSITAIEGYGAIQFFGTFDQISFTSHNPESWSAMTIGISSTGAVPEPATWAMMIMGFGLVGGALRSQRRKVAQTA